LETYAPIRLIMASSPQLPDNIETRKEINLEITQSCLDNGGHYTITGTTEYISTPYFASW